MKQHGRKRLGELTGHDFSCAAGSFFFSYQKGKTKI
uniref:Uncharacterized protein n=1 Tax=Siphoviridae sp. ctb8j11 TaxID=2825564 RepID=A0A8S5PI83_9CAUD|nr:MAG TPA: hypothetical protein [Siphoviridae sp. ctb8j11]